MQPNKQINILCWAFPSWNGEYLKSTIQLMKELSINHNVIYVDYAYTFKDVFIGDKKRNINRDSILKAKYSIRNIKLENGGTIKVISLPPILPINWISNTVAYSIFENFNSLLVKFRLKTVLNNLDFSPDVVINAFNPFFTNSMLELFSKKPLIYYCYDNIDATSWASKHGTRLEKTLLQKANAVIFTSETLRSGKTFTIPSYIVNNGVDITLFEKYFSKTISNRNRKVVGYVGCIDDRLDYELLNFVIENNTQFDFVFVGNVTSRNAKELEKYQNVTFLGSKHASELPKIMSNFDAGIIPFTKNDFTKNIYPMKANEYLAIGLPIVTTDFTYLNDLSGFIETATNKDNFSLLLNRVILNDTSELRQQRFLKSKLNSWKHKANEFENIILQHAS